MENRDRPPAASEVGGDPNTTEPERAVARDRDRQIEKLFNEALELPPGTLLAERYRIVSRLGRGGMGEVYLADDLKLGQTAARHADSEDNHVAIKVAQHGISRHAQQRLRTEYRILAQLDHPAIARVLDAGATDDGRPTR